MRRAAKTLAWVLGAPLAALIAATLLTARYGDAALYPPPPGSVPVDIYVVSHGYHSGIALPRASMAQFANTQGRAALIAVATRFGDYPWLEFGRGEEEFYRRVASIADLRPGLALRALFFPGNEAVVHVVGLAAPPRRMFPRAQIVRVGLSEQGLARMLAMLDAAFMRGGDGRILGDLGRGLYGPSLFYRASGTFNLFELCNHWVARLLDAAGVATAPVLATLPWGLLLDLRWRSGLTPLPRP
ncbi:MAG: DUF2459 domain-containing protein [Proteobacteria bacterium]|nr:DUF2459 domain-containing protein [Pseudomonadota bacterium]